MPTAAKETTAPAEVKPYVFDFTIGADPEFTIISGSKPMHAKHILEAFIPGNGKAINNQRQGGFDVKPFGNIGWDGHHQTGELRPSPSSKPEEVAANIKGLFAHALKHIPFVDFSTLTFVQATGGHIHLSVPEKLVDEMATALNGNTPSPRWAAIERAVAMFTVLILLSENKSARNLRLRSSNYGSILDYRYEQKFTYPSGVPGYTMEVRCPTAEWMTTEDVARGTLAYMAIAWDLIINDKLKDVEKILFRNKTEVNNAIRPLLSDFDGVQRRFLNRLRPVIRRHPAYRQHRRELELILHPARAAAAKRAAHYAVAEGWGLVKSAKSISRSTFFKESKVLENTKEVSEAAIRSVSSFAWNQDINVESFANALSRRSIALGWKPEHEYFFFGLKKGIDSIIIMDENGKFVNGKESFKTRKDAELMRNKFNRLAPKAMNSFGNFIDPRTGKVSGGAERRVMVGIPYSMRIGSSMNEFIELIFNFERDPKAFEPLDESKLPAGESHIEKALEREEQNEQAINTALAQADKFINLSDEDIDDDDIEVNVPILVQNRLQLIVRSGVEIRDATREVIEEYINGTDAKPVSVAAIIIGIRDGFPLNRTQAVHLIRAATGFDSFSERYIYSINSQGDFRITEGDGTVLETVTSLPLGLTFDMLGILPGSGLEEELHGRLATETGWVNLSMNDELEGDILWFSPYAPSPHLF